jgi:hypothetical protein
MSFSIRFMVIAMSSMKLAPCCFVGIWADAAAENNIPINIHLI